MPGTARRVVAASIAVPYLTALTLALLWPQPLDGKDREFAQPAVEWIVQNFGMNHVAAYSLLESTANVLVFIPLGFVMVLFAGRFRWFHPLIAIAVSIGAEYLQYQLLPDRTPDVRDVIGNTAGALVGMGIAWLIVRRRRRAETPRGGRHAQLAPTQVAEMTPSDSSTISTIPSASR